MKKLIIITLFLSFFGLNAQDLEPAQQKFYYYGDPTAKYLSGDSSYFKQNKIFLSWEWMGGGKISKSLDITGHDGFNYTSANEMLDSADLLARRDITSHFPDCGIINVRAIQYEPTLQLSSGKPDSLVIRTGDTTHPVFGFITRRGRIISNPSDTNFNRLIIDSSSLVNQIILDNPWPQDQLIFTNFGDSAALANYQCQTLFISINLRRFDNLLTNDTVLKIELPYIRSDGNSTGYIQFSQVPSQSANGNDTLSNGRGIVRKLVAVGPNQRAFYITRKMMPPYSQHKDITISAFFICDGKPINPPHNQHLNFSDSLDQNPIKNLGIRITYLNSTCPLGIDWVRFETPHERFTFQNN
jgi:hypothetical protein